MREEGLGRVGVGAFICLALGCGAHEAGEPLSSNRSAVVVAPGDPLWPSAWSVADINTNSGSAGATYDTATGAFTLLGANKSTRLSDGAWDFATQNPDVMRFLYTTGSGDVEIIAHVTAVSSDLGRNMGQIGLAIRDGLGSSADEGAGIIQIGGGVADNAGACESGVANLVSCTVLNQHCVYPDYVACTCINPDRDLQGTPPFHWECELGHQQYVTYRELSDGTEDDDPTEYAYLLGNTGAYRSGLVHPESGGTTDFWLRLQRIGDDFSVAWLRDEALGDGVGSAWRPFKEYSGGVFESDTFSIGFFAASQHSDDPNDANDSMLSVTIDNLTVGPVNLETAQDEQDVLRSTWVGSSSALLSTGRVAHDLTGLAIVSHTDEVQSPPVTTQRLYKHTAAVEQGDDLQALDASTGKLLQLNNSMNDHGIFVDGAAFAVDAGHIYVANRKSWGEPYYCVDRFTHDLAHVQGDSWCACTGSPCTYPSYRQLTIPGGITALTRGTEQRVYVTQPDPDLNPATPDAKVVELHLDNEPSSSNLLLEINDAWDVEERPAALVGAHNRLWIAHSATDMPYLRNHDVKHEGSVRCYKYTDGEPCGLIPSCTSTDTTICTSTPTNCVVSPTAVALKPGAATNGSQDTLYVADNGIGRQNVRIFKNLHTTCPVEVGSTLPTLGQPGGIYSGTPGLIDDPSNGGLQRFYNLTGLAVDSAGSVYVASNGLPGFDLRKFSYASSAWSLDWQELGLMGKSAGSEGVDFYAEDPEDDDVVDVYSYNKRLSFDTTETGPGSEWGFEAITYDPECGGSPVSCSGEFDGEVRGRVGGNVVMSALPVGGGNTERYMFVYAGATHPEHYASSIGDLNYYGTPMAINFYRFDGEIAKLAGSIEHYAVDVDPVPANVNDDCDPPGTAVDNDSNRRPIGHLSIWVDENEDQVRQSGELTATADIDDCFVNTNTAYECGNWESEWNCMTTPVDPVDCPSYTNPSCGEPPTPTGIKGFEVDSNGDLWLAMQYEIWHFSFSYVNGVAHYDFAGPPVKVGGQEEGSLSIAEAYGVDYDATNERMYVFHPGAIAAYDDFLTTPTEDYLAGIEPTTAYSTPDADLHCYAGNLSFDVEYDKVFIATRCGTVLVHDANDGSFVTRLVAGPGLSGQQDWKDGGQGIRAHRLSTGEYLVATMETGPSAHTPVFRWCPAGAACQP